MSESLQVCGQQGVENWLLRAEKWAGELCARSPSGQGRAAHVLCGGRSPPSPPHSVAQEAAATTSLRQGCYQERQPHGCALHMGCCKPRAHPGARKAESPAPTLPGTCEPAWCWQGWGFAWLPMYLQAAEHQRDAVLVQVLQHLSQPHHCRVVDAADMVAIQDDRARWGCCWENAWSFSMSSTGAPGDTALRIRQPKAVFGHSYKAQLPQK